MNVFNKHLVKMSIGEKVLVGVLIRRGIQNSRVVVSTKDVETFKSSGKARLVQDTISIKMGLSPDLTMMMVETATIMGTSVRKLMEIVKNPRVS